MGSELVKPHHLNRRAVVCVRQSSPHQVLTNQEESLRLQYALRQRAHELGWHEADIEVIDVDLGLSGAAAAHRQGFKDLVARVTLGEIGLILSLEVTRLARNCSDWYPLLDVCGHRGCLIADRDGVYDPGAANGRLLLGLKGTSIPAVAAMLRNPAYAGAFVYGRTCLREPPRPGGRSWQSPRPDEQWRILVRDKYPACVDWSTYEKIQRMLHDNRAEYVRLKTRGISPRRRRAASRDRLVRRVRPQDGGAKGGSQYVCNHLRTQWRM